MRASTDPQLDPQGKHTGLLAWFAQNHVAANLVMLFVIVAGLFSLSRIRIEFFPKLDINYVMVQVPYLGATPREVETAICQRL
ncbi:MAG: efflux RND transporter permease subunit, partial [Planctomycetota bacterium]